MVDKQRLYILLTGLWLAGGVVGVVSERTISANSYGLILFIGMSIVAIIVAVFVFFE